MDIKNATYKSQMETKNSTHNFKPQINIKTKHTQKKKPYTLRGIIREGTLIIAVSEFYHTYILSDQQGSGPVLPESVLMIKTIPSNRGMAPRVTVSII